MIFLIKKFIKSNTFLIITILFGVKFSYAQSSYLTKNIILVTIDGVRWQEVFSGADELLINDDKVTYNVDRVKGNYWDEDPDVRKKKLMPFLWSVVNENGQIYGNRNKGSKSNLKNKFMVSYPGYSEIITGIADERIESNAKVKNPNLNFLEYLNNKREFKDKAIMFGSWDVYPYVLNTFRNKIPMITGITPIEKRVLTEKEKFINHLMTQIPKHSDGYWLDMFPHNYMMEHLKNKSPRVLFIAYGDTDNDAHDSKYGGYLQSLNRADSFIKEIWDYVQSSRQYKDKTTLLITTDHGRGSSISGEWTGHGAGYDGAQDTWMAVIGPDTPALGEMANTDDVFTNQIAATLVKFLGYDFRGYKPVGKYIKTMIK